MKPQLPREEALFQAASQLSGPTRATFLDQACASNATLRARLDALLAAHEAPQGVLANETPTRARKDSRRESPAQAPGGTEIMVAPDEAIGSTLGRYKLREKIGEGGCGVVYVAEQIEPVRRRVALKVIKLGMDTREVIARFEAERQALAMMDHPNIAKVLDAGTTDTGRPYFVMELVRGVQVTEYCDQNNLSARQRLEVFINVCQAIQHAHQKGIIHRDIKPSNILVTLHDGVPVPKVIDFGIAKAIEGRLTDATVYTQLHQFMGTPAYMSPEQAEMSGLDIDTRSDIYSLGVLLYQLLTSRTPFDGKELLALGLDEMRRTIREKEPLRPSTRLATLQQDELTTTARRRSIEAPRLIHLLQGDLDWIVMKCLEKDRTRRYDTASALAQDLQRHLADEPVTARAPSAGYKFRKFVRRHKVAFGTGTAIVFLALALAASLSLLVKELRAGRHGGIFVRSDPEGAEVWHDDRRIGVTPLEMAGLPVGPFMYTLVLNNYESVTNTTPLAPRKQMNDFTLLRRLESSDPTAARPGTNVCELATVASQTITLLATHGKVEFVRKGGSEWMAAQTNLVLRPGDRLRTGPRSRAMLRGPDASLLRLNEMTSFDLNSPSPSKPGLPVLRLNNGNLYRFNRNGDTNALPVVTPTAKGTIRG